MRIAKVFLSLLTGSALTRGSPIETDTLLEERKSEVANADGYLIASYGDTQFRAGAVGLGVTALFYAPFAYVVISYGSTLWRTDTPPPVSASIPAGNASSGKTKRETATTAFNVELYAGYDYHNSTNPLTDDNWVDAIEATIAYMNQQQVECLQAFADDPDTDYENRMTIWIDTGDGVDHRSC